MDASKKDDDQWRPPEVELPPMIGIAQRVPQGAWFKELDPRKQKQVLLSLVYQAQFDHGASGHNDMQIIAYLARKLEGWDEPQK